MDDIAERIIVDPEGDRQVTDLIRILPDGDEVLIKVGNPLPVSKEAKRLSEGLGQWKFGVYFDPENSKRSKLAGFYDPVGNNVVMFSPDAMVFRHETTHAMIWNLSSADQSELVRIFGPFRNDLGTFYQHLVIQDESYASSLSGETRLLELKDFVRVNGGGGLVHRDTFAIQLPGEKPVLVSTIAVIDELLAYNYGGNASWGDRFARKTLEKLNSADRKLIDNMGLGVFPWRKVLARMKTLRVGNPNPAIKIG